MVGSKTLAENRPALSFLDCSSQAKIIVDDSLPGSFFFRFGSNFLHKENVLSDFHLSQVSRTPFDKIIALMARHGVADEDPFFMSTLIF